MLPQYTENIQKWKLRKKKQKENDNEKYNISRNLQILAVLDPQSYPSTPKKCKHENIYKEKHQENDYKIVFFFHIVFAFLEPQSLVLPRYKDTLKSKN